MNSTVVLTPSSLMDFLSQVDELGDLQVAVSETPDGNVQVLVGDSVYSIDCSQAEDVYVPDEVVDTVDDINEQAYEDIVDGSDMVDPVEGGLIAEVVKTLAIGGLARLAGKAVKDALR